MLRIGCQARAENEPRAGRRRRSLPVETVTPFAWCDLEMDWVNVDEHRDLVVARDGVRLSTARTGEGEPHVLWLHGGPGMFDYLAAARVAAAFPMAH